MTRLIVVNGPPGCGKSTLARRYADDHPLTLNLDIDRIRDLLGRWQEHPQQAGLLARAVTLAAARTHLDSGHDVVIPQFLARPEFLEQAERLAHETNAAFHEIVLMDTRDNAVRRHQERERTSGDEPAQWYDRLLAMIATRPAATVVHNPEGEIEQGYRELLNCVAADAPAR